MLNIKTLIAATVLSGVAAMSFAATPEAPKVATAAAAADAGAMPAKKKMVHHAKKAHKAKAAAAK